MENFLFEKWLKDKSALSNEVFINDKKDIVCKKFIKNDFSFIYGNQELNISKNLSDINILKKGKSYVCYKYINHKPFNTSTADSSLIKLIAKKLRKIHSEIDVKNIININMPNFKETWRWLKLNKNIPNYLNEDKIFEAAMKIVDKDLVLANNDLVDGNILVVDNDVIFIDYEYGGINSKYFDIASFVVKRKLSVELEKVFLETYFENDFFNKVKYKISKHFFAIFWSKWSWHRYFVTDEKIYKEIAHWLYKNK